MSDETNQDLASALELTRADLQSVKLERDRLLDEVKKLRLDTETLTKQRDTFEEGFQTQSRKHEAAAKKNTQMSRDLADERDQMARLRKQMAAERETSKLAEVKPEK